MLHRCCIHTTRKHTWTKLQAGDTAGQGDDEGADNADKQDRPGQGLDKGLCSW